MRQRGFTLLEVMVATLIMAIAVTGLLSAISTSMRSAARLTDYDRAAQLARQKMDELLIATLATPKNTVVEGRWDPALTGGLDMGWRAKITTFEKPEKAGPGSAVMDRIELEIWWMKSDQRRTFTLEGFRRGVLTKEEAPQ